MKKIIYLIASIIIFGTAAHAATVCFPSQGCTGTSTPPRAGQVLIGNSSSTYTPAYLTAGSNVTISTSSGAITISSTGGGGGGTPGGSDTQVQFNDAGSFGGDSNFVWDNSNATLIIPKILADATLSIGSKDALSIYTQNQASADTQGPGIGITLGNGNGIGEGGGFTLIAGDGGATSGNGGSVSITGGRALGGDSDGGSVEIGTFSGSGSGLPGTITFTTQGTGVGIAGTNYKATLDPESLVTADRTFSFPDQSGTFALGTGSTGLLAYWASTSTLAATSTPSLTELGYLSGVTSPLQTQINAKQATITGGATTIATSDLTASRALMSNSSGKVAVSTTTAAELGFVNGVTSAIQTQIDGKQATITGGATSIVSSNLTANRALMSDGSGKVSVSTTTAAELGFVNGVTSAIQTQLGTKEGTITAGTTAQYWRGDKSFQTLNQAAVAGLTTSDSPTFTGVSVTNATSSGTLVAPKDKTLATSGQVSVNTTASASSASTLKFHDGSAERVLNPEKCFAPSWVIENPTSAEDIPVMVFNNTSTITKVKAVNKTSGDTITFNLGYGPSRATATGSLPKLFSSNQTVTATTTISSLTINSSSTPNANDILRFYTTSASTSQFTLDVCYRENP